MQQLFGKKIGRRNLIRAAGAITAAGAIAISMSDLFDDVLAGEESPLIAQSPSEVIEERWVPTTCWIGKQDCGMLARVVDGRVVKLEGNPSHPRNLGTLCPKGQAQIIAFYDPYRVKAPLKRVNEKGVPGEWVEISWDEALDLVAQKIKEARAKDPRTVVWQKGRSKAGKFYDNAFVKTLGATQLHHGAYCSDAGYRASEYTIGFNGVLHPDLKNCKYMIAWGWNMVNAGGNKLCYITFQRQLLDARSRGMKVVTLDPLRLGGGPHTNEWLPIRPGTDLAFWLVVANVLIEEGFVDREYLTKYTNAPFLVKEDGYFLRVDGKEAIWDTTTGSAKPYDAEEAVPVLEGEYAVEGIRVKTAFQLFKEHVAKYTPEWASEVCGLPASTIRRVALELGQNAMIGSKIALDGVELPYRPVGVMAYHVSQQELGFQAVRACIIVFMLLGAVEAVGGVRSDFARKLDDRFKRWDSIEIKDPPYNIYLGNSKFFPINSNNSSIVADAMLNPQKYGGLEYLPEIMIIHMSNTGLYPPVDKMREWLKMFMFIVAIDPWMSETASLFADIVLPAATIEKYEGPMDVTDGYVEGYALRIPPMAPLFKSRGEIEIYMDICERVGVLYGEGGYLDILNKELGLKDPYRLNLYRKPSVREIFDKWARSIGIEEGIEYFEKGNIYVRPIPVNRLYAPAWNPPYGGIRHRLYGESLKRYQDIMKEKSVPEPYYRDYTPFPTWREPTMNKSPTEYDLFLISYKKVEFKQSRSAFIPLLHELEPEQHLLINPATARVKEIGDGEEVWVESHNALTGETKKIKVKTKYIEGIRPDTVALSHHYGLWSHPWARKSGGPTPNELFFTGEGYVSMTADQSYHVKVKLYKGG